MEDIQMSNTAARAQDVQSDSATTKYVYLFNEVDQAEKAAGGTWDDTRSLLGGKGANLADMTRLDVPVPPGFTVTTAACNAYLEAGEQFPQSMWEQELEAVKAIEQATGKKFGDPDNPLLVSCRSGAKFSMPGMMDTILNIGLSDEVVEGLIKLTGDRRFVYDLYRRLVQMFGSVVMGVPDEVFDAVITATRKSENVKTDAEISAEAWQKVTSHFKEIFRSYTGIDFPTDPYEQLRMATEAVFKSWNGKRAVDYRNAAGIAHDLGTAVNIQTMVFGNMGENSATGVAMSRDAGTGEKELEGDFLVNAQGEDVVAGIRTPQSVKKMSQWRKDSYDQLIDIKNKLEKHYKDVPDFEFTIEHGKLWMLQTRTGKRTGRAAVKIAVDMMHEGLIDRAQAVRQVSPAHLNQLLHPTVDPEAEIEVLATGIAASPGAAQGQVVFHPDEAEALAGEGRDVILVRQETSPDDFHGMAVSRAIVTARGGSTSHAAVVARGMGTPCVAGADALQIDYDQQQFSVNDKTVPKGEWITVDGSSGRILLGQVPTVDPQTGEEFAQLMEWTDAFRRLGVRTNADTPQDARVAREFGAEGIGLCRTEHMFFGDERLAVMREMILADGVASREKALAKLLPYQRADFVGLFRAMDGLPVTVRLLDPPLHEFLPNLQTLMDDLAELKLSLQQATTLHDMNALLDEVDEKRRLLRQVERLHEANPMLGHRGCRLGLVYPEVTRMQVRALFEAACQVHGEEIDVRPEVMVPLVATAAELQHQAALIHEIAKDVMGEYGITLDYEVGTMIELPRAALTADQVAEHAAFFSFGTNDLTQTTYGLSRDDAARFLSHYVERKIFPDDPFQVLDRDGVGQLVRLATERGRSTTPGLKVGICGEHGGDPQSVAFCHEIGLDYVSCSPYRVPVARLAAAQAALEA
jgi:pyruvate,orthophosphate dikinase